MNFEALLDQTLAMLQRRGRVTYRTLKLQFDLDDDKLEALKEELLYSTPQVTDDAGRGLIWNGDGETAPSSISQPPQSQSPSTYTPQHLAERIRAEQAAMESRGAANGERKTITALFADLKGSTALIESLDPEDARAIIDPALQLMMDAVHRYDGYVAQALGDGIFALFGAPIAHEDHPQRALYAALRMQEEMRQYAEKLREEGGTPLQMRVGINTGEVVVRSIRKDDLHTDYVPVGHSTNLAARMEQVANPGSIVVTEQTHKLTDGYFNFEALGKTKVKGVEEPVPIYEVTGAGPLRTRLQVSARRGLSRFVGRHSEMEQMNQALEQTKAGHGQIVGVIGEPGLGKSRLFYEFKLTAQSGCLVLEAFAVSHGQASPYLPLIELLKEYFQIEPADDERTRRAKVMGQVLALDKSLGDILPYVLALLGLDDAESSLQQMDAQIRRQRTFEAVKKLFLRESLNQPLILIFEDLHWIDTETQGFLDTLTESVASTQVLVLVNYRSEYQHEWGQKTYYTQLRLTPLGEAEAEELLTFLVGNDASLATLLKLILERTEGTPFFMEEVVQSLLEEGVLVGERGKYRVEIATADLHVPQTVQGILAARIDRLTPDEKALLQQLSVIGRQFPARLVRQVIPQSEDEMYRLLVALQSKEYLYEQPTFPESDYLFKHALTQEVAYGTVLLDQRKALHEQTAEAIETLYPDSLEDHYSELAHHYGRSDNAEKAVTYLELAGQQAAQRSAYGEARNNFQAALELLKTLPETPQRSQRELPLQLTLGAALMVVRGVGSPDVERVYSRARELAQRVGSPEQLFLVLWSLSYHYTARAEYQAAEKLGHQCLALAQQEDDAFLLIEAHYALGLSLICVGQVAEANTHFEQSLVRYDPQHHHALSFQYAAQDPGVYCRGDVAFALWMLGYPDQALTHVRQALSLARELSHPQSQAFALAQTGLMHLFRAEAHAAQELAEAVIVLSTERGLPYYLAWGIVLQGRALAAQGQVEAGLAKLHEGLTDLRAIDSVLMYTVFSGLLAETQGQAGQVVHGLATVAEAVAFVERTGQHWWDAELYRLKGDLTLQKSTEHGAKSKEQEEAEFCFLKAIEIAQKQQAKSWELRAATSLARLWQGQGKTTESRELLAPVYNWFTEGFDTADLKDAKALLDVLEAGTKEGL